MRLVHTPWPKGGITSVPPRVGVADGTMAVRISPGDRRPRGSPRPGLRGRLPGRSAPRPRWSGAAGRWRPRSMNASADRRVGPGVVTDPPSTIRPTDELGIVRAACCQTGDDRERHDPGGSLSRPPRQHALTRVPKSVGWWGGAAVQDAADGFASGRWFEGGSLHWSHDRCCARWSTTVRGIATQAGYPPGCRRDAAADGRSQRGADRRL